MLKKLALALVLLALLVGSALPATAQIGPLLPGAIAVQTLPHSGLSGASAVLEGSLTSLGGQQTVQVAFEWGATAAYGNQTPPQARGAIGPFSATISGLTAGATYHYRAIALSGGAPSAHGADMSFTTMPPHPLTVSTASAGSVTAASASLHGVMTSQGPYSEVNVWFEWGATASYGQSTPPQLFHDPGAFEAAISGLTAGATYHFRAVANGNVPGAVTVLGSDMTFRTTAPALIAVSTQAATSLTGSSAALNGSVTSMGSVSSVIVLFEWGPTTAYGNSTPQRSVSAPGPFNTPITGLAPGIIYHYRSIGMAAPVGATPVYGNDVTFTLAHMSVSTLSATGVSAASANLNGRLDSLGGMPSVQVAFEWGPSTAYGNSLSAGELSTPGGFSAALTGLSAGVTYHFRAVGASGALPPSYGADSIFTTGSSSLNVNTSAATSIQPASATLNGYLGSLGSSRTVDVWFEWGPDSSMTGRTARSSRQGPSPFSVNISPLTSGAVYYFRAAAQSSAPGAPVVYGQIATFNTSGPPYLAITTQGATGISTNSAILNGYINTIGPYSPVHVWFEWGPGSASGYSTSAGTLFSSGPFQVSISGLSPATTYVFHAVADTSSGPLAYGQDVSFTTASSPVVVVSTQSPTNVAPNSATLNGYLNSMGPYNSVQVWFEYGPTLAYGSYTPAVYRTALGGFTADIAGLAPQTAYHFRTASSAGGSNSYSADSSFVTGGAAPTPTPTPPAPTPTPTPTPAPSPAVATAGPQSVADTSATLTGSISSMGGFSIVQVYFEYGSSTAYGSTTPVQSLATAGQFSAAVSGLTPGATYHYRAVVVGGGAAPVRGSDIAFTTNAGGGGFRC